MSRRFALYALIAGCLVFAAILFREVTAPATADPPTIAAAPAAAMTAPVTLPPRPENVRQLLATALARPLFDPSRRPPGKSDSGAGASGLGDSRLTGIVTQPDRRIAIFAVPGGKPLVVGEGENVNGWHIDSITPQEISLTGPEGTKTLRPKSDPNLLVRAVAPVQTVLGRPVPMRAVPVQMRPAGLPSVPPQVRPAPLAPQRRPTLPVMPPAFRPPQR